MLDHRKKFNFANFFSNNKKNFVCKSDGIIIRFDQILLFNS
jgi:hypothetical protein